MLSILILLVIKKNNTEFGTSKYRRLPSPAEADLAGMLWDLLAWNQQATPAVLSFMANPTSP